ncbi:MAG: ABC transporter ATP-binding protein [Thermanaerothrix sp.]|jgi:peptide/nickel transport system ATP-binding protein|uniref:ABC transporter ATP-binding protein n=1 Tax=Thermanaerothrix solaris TaxID=3058434 RepID=A0ABU3NL73_9CHLR|nr:ABC transporter ATP-binding protein [Thermanaerothrix sp. 4228-RoL]MDT8897589.1 ABC transporter ATP-binding protein [Thermanaerothrix sp. 4228-RoL]
MALNVENLTVYYQTLRGDVHALEHATFQITDGEIMGLAGESGCGKTTLGHSLIVLFPPMKYITGRVLLDGEELPIWDAEKMNAYRFRKVSLIPQYAMNAMNPIRKIGKMTQELLESRGVDFKEVLPELKRRLDLVALPHDVLNMYPIELSGGMKQRMVMVISSLLNPSLLIADEITSALDVATQKAVAEMLVEFRDRQFVNNLIVITHDISVLYQIADTILIMYAGVLAEKAPTKSIIESPRHPYTRLLISSLPEVGVRHAEKRLQGIPGNPPLLLNPPSGCRFRDRCPLAFERCLEEPPFIEVEKNHFVACWKEFEPHA